MDTITITADVDLTHIPHARVRVVRDMSGLGGEPGPRTHTGRFERLGFTVGHEWAGVFRDEDTGHTQGFALPFGSTVTVLSEAPIKGWW